MFMEYGYFPEILLKCPCQNFTKITFFMFLYQIQGYWSFLLTLTKFDLRVTFRQ